MLTPVQASRLVALALKTNWSSLAAGEALELSDVLSKLQAWALANGGGMNMPAWFMAHFVGRKVEMPADILQRALAAVKRHRDICDIKRPEHLELLALCEALEKTIGS